MDGLQHRPKVDRPTLLDNSLNSVEARSSAPTITGNPRVKHPRADVRDWQLRVKGPALQPIRQRSAMTRHWKIRNACHLAVIHCARQTEQMHGQSRCWDFPKNGRKWRSPCFDRKVKL